MNLETDFLSELGQMCADVPCSDNVELGDGSIGSMYTSICPPQIRPVSCAKSSDNS